MRALGAGGRAPAGSGGDRDRRRLRAICRCSSATSAMGLCSGVAVGERLLVTIHGSVPRRHQGGRRRCRRPLPVRQLRWRRAATSISQPTWRRTRGSRRRPSSSQMMWPQRHPSVRIRGAGSPAWSSRTSAQVPQQSVGMTSKRSRMPHVMRSRTRGRWVSACRRRSSPLPGSRRSSSAKARWRSASASTANAGVRRGPLETADAIADDLFDAIMAELDLASGDDVAVMVNGLGATPPEELYILYRRIAQRLADLGVKVHRPYIGEYATSLEMAGASLTIMRLDERLRELLDAPAPLTLLPAMNGAELRGSVVRRVGSGWTGIPDELRDLDAAIGDGDLGITVSEGSRAARDAVVDLRSPAPRPAPSPARHGTGHRAGQPFDVRGSRLGGTPGGVADTRGRRECDQRAAASRRRESAPRRSRHVARRTKVTRRSSMLLVPSIDAAASEPDRPLEAALTGGPCRCGGDTRDGIGARASGLGRRAHAWPP